jgi:homoserine/homoserine lactone efflux protein
MNIETILTYSLIALVSIVTPGPAVLLALRNGVALGLGAVAWSSLGNVTGLLLLSTAAMLGLGALLDSSAVLFTLVKLLGAFYLLYIGMRHILGRSLIHVEEGEIPREKIGRSRCALFREAFLIAVANPKPILFFTALFPQFLNIEASLFPQFLLLTGIFMALSFATLMAYAYAATRIRKHLTNWVVVKWINRMVGAMFLAFGCSLAFLRRPAPEVLGE